MECTPLYPGQCRCRGGGGMDEVEVDTSLRWSFRETSYPSGRWRSSQDPLLDEGEVDPLDQEGLVLVEHPLVLREDVSPDRHPAAVYLARLSPGSRRTMRAALQTIAGLLSGGQLDAQRLDWGAVRYQHTAALRS